MSLTETTIKKQAHIDHTIKKAEVSTELADIFTALLQPPRLSERLLLR